MTEWSYILGNHLSAVELLAQAPDTTDAQAVGDWLEQEALTLYSDAPDREALERVDWRKMALGLMNDARVLCASNGHICASCLHGACWSSDPGGPPLGGPQEYADCACDLDLDCDKADQSGQCDDWALDPAID